MRHLHIIVHITFSSAAKRLDCKEFTLLQTTNKQQTINYLGKKLTAAKKEHTKKIFRIVYYHDTLTVNIYNKYIIKSLVL